jgi:hypothetical protein
MERHVTFVYSSVRFEISTSCVLGFQRFWKLWCFLTFLRNLISSSFTVEGEGTKFFRWAGHAVVQLTEALRCKPIPDGVTGIFLWPNPSGRTMTLTMTQPLTETSTRNISGGKGGCTIWLTTLTPSCAECLEIRALQPSGTLRACTWIALHLPFTALWTKCLTGPFALEATSWRRESPGGHSLFRVEYCS